MPNPHENHRKRLKQRYLKHGLEGLEPHVIIELLLGYSIPRRDTNEIAHDLIARFGSIRGIMNANYNDLLKVKYITEHSAILIRLIHDLFEQCALPEQDYRLSYNTFEEIGELIHSFFIDYRIETVHAFAFDSKRRLISHKIVHRGDFTSATFKMKSITEFAISARADCIVLAHNHPNNSLYPSSEDLTATKNIWASLNSNSIELIEHFVVNENGYARIMPDLILF